ncbi:MAG: exodeoxyribonuclease VII large subunit, partial [Gammaproteobacteria bacterium]|nr:exodeoxyribonuclease VII large subunit [Gammaproteobacteria bacterium]
SSLRAPTPTAAAEIASETLFNINTKLNELLNDLKSKFETGFEKKLNKINTLKIKIKNPVTYIRELSQKIDTFELRFNQSLRSLISNKKELLNNLENSVFLKSPILKTERIKNSLTKINEDLVKIYVNLMRNKKLEIDKYSKSLEILNPFSILERGYSIITNKNGKAIRSSVELSENEILDARFGQGKAKLSVKSKNED